MSEMISIVIPCYNEQDSIPPLMATLHLLREQMQKEHPTITIEVIVVEDGSTDDSYSMLKNYDFVNVLKNSQNIGYGASLKKGFAQAGGEWVCFFDMDLTYPIELLPRMWKKLIADDLDLVNGRRSFVAPGMSFFRGIGN